MGRVAGVDGCRDGWVVVTTGSSGGPSNAEVIQHFTEVVSRVDRGQLSIVAVDIPIGLASGFRRRSDDAARAMLGSRRSTLFFTPDHAVLGVGSYDAANAASRRASGHGLSKQAWNLMAKTHEVRSAIGEPRVEVAEVHPETSFTAMNAGDPLPPKKTADGIACRRALLRTEFADVDLHLAGLGAGVGVDDVLDAFAAAWTARRIAGRTATSLGDGIDPDGFSLAMWV